MPPVAVSRIKIVSSPALSLRIDIRSSTLTNFPQTATIDQGSISDGTQITALLDNSGDMTLRIYCTPFGNLMEIYWTKKGGWQSWKMHDTAAPGVARTNSRVYGYVFFQAKIEYLSVLYLNMVEGQWQFTEVI